MTKKEHETKKTDSNKLLIPLLIVVIGLALIINVFYLEHRSTDDKTSTTQVNSGQILTSLQTGNNGGVEARISAVTENGSNDPAFTIDPSETMLIMSINIKNLTKVTQHLIPDTQLYVRTDQGNYSAIHASMFVTKPLNAQDLNPNQSASGQISFNVPKIAEKPYLYIDTGWGGYTPIVFNVLH